jgi:hypothetical protein
MHRGGHLPELTLRSPLLITVAAAVILLVAAVIITQLRHRRKDALTQLRNENDQLRKSLEEVQRYNIAEIKSPFPMVEVVAEKEGEIRQTPIISAISTTGKQFFGYAPSTDSDKFIGKPITDFMEELKNYIAPPSSYWDDLAQDQARVMTAFYRGQTPIARYPVILNSDHPEPEFRNKWITPLIVEGRTTKASGEEHEYVKVIYLDISRIPRYVLRRELWETVKSHVNPVVLSDELQQLISALNTADSVNGNEETVTALEQAVADLNAGGSTTVIESCAKVGFFWLQEHARKMKLTNLNTLIGRIIGV